MTDGSRRFRPLCATLVSAVHAARATHFIPRNGIAMDMFRMEHGTIGLRPLAVARALGLVAFLLAMASLTLEGLTFLTGHDLLTFFTGRDHSYGLRGLFSLDNEHNIPALYSAALLLFAALLLLVITLHERNRGARDASRWALLSAGFLLMAIDESLSFHDKFIEPTRQLLGPGHHGLFYFAWVIPGFALVLVLGASFLPFLLRLPAATRFIFIAAAAIYLGGALGMELFDGRYRELHGTEFAYHLMVAAEESLEMAGAILFIYGLLRYLADHHPETRFMVHDLADPLPAPGKQVVAAHLLTDAHDPTALGS